MALEAIDSVSIAFVGKVTALYLNEDKPINEEMIKKTIDANGAEFIDMKKADAPFRAIVLSPMSFVSLP